MANNRWIDHEVMGHNGFQEPYIYSKSSFNPQDVVESTFVSAYLVMAIAVLAAFVTAKDYSVKKSQLSAQFVTYAVLTAAAFGFGGIAFHVIFDYQENETDMSNHWFRTHSEWLWPWTAAVCLMPMASSGLLSTSLAFVDVGIYFTRLVKVVGGLFAIFECYETFADLAATGKASVVWGFITTIIGASVIVVKGGQKIVGMHGAITYLIGLGIHLVAWLVLVAAPRGCWHVLVGRGNNGHSSSWHEDCPYSEDFNQRGMFCVVNMIALVVLYTGVMARLPEESKPPPGGYTKQPALLDRTCCLPS